MHGDLKNNLLRIGVFYDGNFFYHVSNYYSYAHQRRARISIDGLHQFIRHKVADEFKSDIRLCQIVDARYFRGRLSAAEASSREKLIYHERVFDDILISSGVTTHYLPLKSYGGRFQEKGSDVWLALEAYELSMYKHFNVVVLIAGDGDYVALARKLNTLGTRVMVLGWDFDTVNDFGKQFSTRTSTDLLEEATYPVLMHEVIDSPTNSGNAVIDGLFVGNRDTTAVFPLREEDEEATTVDEAFREYTGEEEQEEAPPELISDGERQIGEIFVIKEGYGFIGSPPDGTFFHYSDLMNCDFNDLRHGDRLAYDTGVGPEGRKKAINIELLDA